MNELSYAVNVDCRWKNVYYEQEHQTMGNRPRFISFFKYLWSL